MPDLPGCDQTDDFAFVGETTLASLGLREFAGGQESIRTGMIWVTAGPVSGGEREPPSRLVCIQFPDGSGIAGPIQDDWRPPAGFVGNASAGDERPILLGMVLVIAVVVAVSFVAFRRDTPA